MPSLLDPAELADIRADVQATMTDQAYMLRPADQAAETAAGGPQGGLSNSAGGIRQGVSPISVNAPQPQYNQVGGAIPCRLASYPRGLGEFLNSSIGVLQGKSSYRLKLPYQAQVNDSDRIRVVTDVDDFVYEVIAVEPRTDQFSRSLRLSRIE